MEEGKDDDIVPVCPSPWLLLSVRLANPPTQIRDIATSSNKTGGATITSVPRKETYAAITSVPRQETYAD